MIYALPLLLLIGIIVAFFAVAGGRYRQFGVAQVLLRALVALPLVVSGVLLHFIRARATVGMVPAGFPDPVFLVALSGVLEVAGAAGLFLPRWRRRAGLLLALLMVAVFPANIAVAGTVVGGVMMPSVQVRTALQVVYILLLLVASFGWPRISTGSKSA